MVYSEQFIIYTITVLYFDAIVGDFVNEFVKPDSDKETFISQQQGHTTAGNDVLEKSKTESYAPDRIR